MPLNHVALIALPTKQSLKQKRACINWALNYEALTGLKSSGVSREITPSAAALSELRRDNYAEVLTKASQRRRIIF